MFQNHGKEQDNERVARLKLTTQLVSHFEKNNNDDDNCASQRNWGGEAEKRLMKIENPDAEWISGRSVHQCFTGSDIPSADETYRLALTKDWKAGLH